MFLKSCVLYRGLRGALAVAPLFWLALSLCVGVHQVCATLEVGEEDLRESKARFMVSKLSPQNSVVLENEGKGVLTLCFRPQNMPWYRPDFEHAALVFERFVNKEVKVQMVHYSREEDCCGFGGTEKVLLDSQGDTVKKTVRAWKVSSVDSSRTEVPPSYTRYASWFLGKAHLEKGMITAEEDSGKHDIPDITSPNCVKYVTRVMKACGMTGLDFGWWATTPNNLRALVRDHVAPKPDVWH